MTDHTTDALGHEKEASAEYIDETLLFKERVAAVERAAEAGEYGEPLRFRAASELEFGVAVVEPDKRKLLLANAKSEAVLDWAEKGQVVLPADIEALAEPDEALNDHYRQIAREYVAALPARSEGEERRRQEWLADIDGFTVSDIINFRFYCEFSNPTLGDPSPPKGGTLDELTQHTEQNGWVEFRFGTGTLQKGYYDNKTVAEFRTNPCEPSELIEREAFMRQRLADIAAEHGAIVAMPGLDVNISAYQQDAQGEWRPIIGHQQDRQEKTLAVASGLSAGIESGAWMSDKMARERILFGKLAQTYNWRITGVRDAVRLQNDVVEIREPNFIGTTAHGLLWGMSSISYGLERNEQDGFTQAELVPNLIAVPTERFDKDRDLQLLRLIEKSKMEQRSFVVDSSYASLRGAQLYNEVFDADEQGEPNELYAIFAKLFASAITLEDDGRLLFDPVSFYASRLMLDDEVNKQFSGEFDVLCQKANLDIMAAYVARDAVRTKAVDAVVAVPQYPGYEPAELEQAMLTSRIAQRMFGNHLGRYAKRVATTGAAHYRPIESEEDEQQLYEELLKRLGNKP